MSCITAARRLLALFATAALPLSVAAQPLAGSTNTIAAQSAPTTDGARKSSSLVMYQTDGPPVARYHL